MTFLLIMVAILLAPLIAPAYVSAYYWLCRRRDLQRVHALYAEQKRHNVEVEKSAMGRLEI